MADDRKGETLPISDHKLSQEDLWGEIEDDVLLRFVSDECNYDTSQDSPSLTKRKHQEANLYVDDEDGEARQAKTTPSPLRAFRQGYLWVSDFCSQSWCEQQMVYRFTLPTILVEDPIMTAGTDLHLARELEVQDVVKVSVTSDEDIFAVKVMNLVGAVDNCLGGTPVCREIPIFGAPFDQDVFLVGMIDEIRVDLETFDFSIMELKTRSSRTVPGKAQKLTHAIQVMVYKKLFDDLVKGKTNKDMIKHHLGVKMEKAFGEGVLKHLKLQRLKAHNLDELLDYMYDRLASVPCVSQLLVEYCFQKDSSTIAMETVTYDEKWLEEKLLYYLSFWKGQREVAGVEIEEAWKCQRCDFSEVCDWRESKVKECQQKNRVKPK